MLFFFTLMVSTFLIHIYIPHIYIFVSLSIYMRSLSDYIYFNVRADRVYSESVASEAYVRIFAQNNKFQRPRIFTC